MLKFDAQRQMTTLQKEENCQLRALEVSVCSLSFRPCIKGNFTGGTYPDLGSTPGWIFAAKSYH